MIELKVKKFKILRNKRCIYETTSRVNALQSYNLLKGSCLDIPFGDDIEIIEDSCIVNLDMEMIE